MAHYIKIKIGRDGDAFEVFPCGHYTVTHVHEGSQAIARGLEASPGVRLDLSNPSRTLRLPQDGTVAYVMNDRGDTIDTYRWPPRDRHAEGSAVDESAGNLDNLWKAG